MNVTRRWRCRSRVASTGVLLAAFLGGRGFARAQERAPAGEAERAEDAPPALREAVDATYPSAALDARLEATVVLELTVDAEGRVTAASVVEPAGHGFDEAAVEAVRRARFEPARRRGVPVAARIRFPHRFVLPSSVPGAEAPASEAPASETPIQPSPATPVEPSPPPVHEITVRGGEGERRRLQHSAEAVTVVETRKAREQAADLGEVLARTQGVAVRRDGGLGSQTRLSMNGLYDDQIRFFLDGVPLELAGFPFGVANVPVNLVERLEVYRGVVPIRFGADALGGAIHVVRDRSFRPHLGASYQVGSYHTRRLTLDGAYRHEPTGWVVGGSVFVDSAKNDYLVDVEAPDARGRLTPITVRRFHDAYRAHGATLETGIVDRPWAKRLLVSAFFATFEKELQHNVVMTVPYGEVTYGQSVRGVTGRYEVDLRPNLELEVVANHAHRTITADDASAWVYDWYGRRVREKPVGGEIGSVPTRPSVWQDSTFGRAVAKWAFADGHALRLATTPVFTTRSGEERAGLAPGATDPLSAKRDLFTLVSGLEYQIDAFDEALSNVAFVKDYVYRVDSEELLPGGGFQDRSADEHALGVGDALRYRFERWLYAKASYEYATRLPRPDELFGDGVLVLPNLGLTPEVSHNVNLGPRLELRHADAGALDVDVNAFLRESDRLIVLLGNDRYFTYQNVYRARSAGVESAVAWSSPRRGLSLGGTFTWQDVRNRSDEGPFGRFDGDRVPNRPYLFASWEARLRFTRFPGRDDTLEPFYNARYVHAFLRGWESQGLSEFKQRVDAQLAHNVGLSWSLVREAARVVSTIEVDNLTDARLYDNFGVQRPRRAVFVKMTGEWR